VNEDPVIAAFARLSEAIVRSNLCLVDFSEAIVRANLYLLDLALESGFEPEVVPSWEVERESFLRHITEASDDDSVGGEA
jgi:hypothetical protein